MLIFDQLKKNDPQLRLMSVVVLAGVFILAAGLWWVQIVSAQDYKENLKTQAFRSVRIPAVRGKILDRNGAALAENRPTYSVSLYLEELRDQFDAAFTNEAHAIAIARIAAEEQKLHRTLTSKERRKFFSLNRSAKEQLREKVRYEVASNVVEQIGEHLRTPLNLDAEDFSKHSKTLPYIPYPVVENLDSTGIARFEEQNTESAGVDLSVQSTRVYPYGTRAAHVLGYLRSDNSSKEGEESFFWYRLPDYRGVLGLEWGYDSELCGHAGGKSVLINNLGYRQTENVWSPAEPGRNLVLTIDSRIQEVVEKALPVFGTNKTRGAAVVMDVHTGDILAMASVPTYEPGDFIPHISPSEYADIQKLDAEKNRATQENYRPGSIFKPIVAIACLENGMDPNAIYTLEPNPRDPAHGYIRIARNLEKRDTAPPGRYDFKRALIHSSNGYFIYHGIQPGNLEKIVEIGRRFHLGERIGLPTRQETSGTFPDQKHIRSGWSIGDTANLCIGQGYIDVTPLQMTVVAAAIANGGKVLWPRLVDHIEPQDPLSGEKPAYFPKSQVRDILNVKPRTLKILQEAMLDDTDNQEGTAYFAFLNSPVLKEMKVCGKTGTAQNEVNGAITHTVWFLSFAPYENPRYAVVVMVENGSSGGGTCAPIARQIYEGILNIEKAQAKSTVAQKN